MPVPVDGGEEAGDCIFGFLTFDIDSGGPSDKDVRRMSQSAKYKERYALTGVTIGGATYKGVFLYPDNYNGEVVSNSMTWDAINAAGIVFLPAAGFRYGSHVYNVGDYGNYWSSSAYDEVRAYRVDFNSNVSPDSFDRRYYGFSVRLITESK